MKHACPASKAKTVETYHHGDLRAALLKAAGQIIREVGVEALSLRACARRAGVSHGAPAHHFGSLAGLLTEFASEGFEGLAAAMRLAVSHTPVDELRGAGLGYIRFAMNAPEQFRLMWRTELLSQDSTQLQKARKGARDCLNDALITAYKKANGRMPSETTIAVRSNLAWCCVHGYACLWVEGSRKSRDLSDAERMLSALRPVLIAPDV